MAVEDRGPRGDRSSEAGSLPDNQEGRYEGHGKSAANTVLDTRSKYARYCGAVAETRIAHPEWRRGQAHFNVLTDFDPKFAEEIRGFDLDPFYDNGMVEHLLTALAERWSVP